jgi:hypothetical protein
MNMWKGSRKGRRLHEGDERKRMKRRGGKEGEEVRI